MAFELPIYRFKRDVSFEEAKKIALRLNDVLAETPGFRSRTTCYDEKSDTWIDLVEWGMMEHALVGFEELVNSSKVHEFRK